MEINELLLHLGKERGERLLDKHGVTFQADQSRGPTGWRAAAEAAASWESGNNFSTMSGLCSFKEEAGKKKKKKSAFPVFGWLITTVNQ